jgi:hypothetical protein
MSTIYTTADDFDINLSKIGALAAAPASGTVSVVGKRLGNFWSLDFTLTAARMTVTDAAGSGSSGSLQLFDFNPGVLHVLSSVMNFTAFAESAGVSGGDTVFDIGVGTVAIAAAADGVLTGAATYDNVAAKADVTLSSGAGTVATAIDLAALSVDGTSTAADLYLNWSGTAATVDASGTLDVTGTIRIAGIFLGDD